MKQIAHFIGMQRSGNHALINWMLQNALHNREGATAIHLNDVYPTFIPRELRQAHNPDLQVRSTSPNILVLISYEDQPLSLIPSLPTKVNENYILPDAKSQTFLLLRDPYNTFASRVNHQGYS